MDPFLIVMLGLIVLLMFFMFRNGKKRQQAIQDMHSNLKPGADVMLQSGIFGTVEEIDEEDNRVTVRSGTSSIVVHRNAVAQILAAADAVDELADVAPDDDPEFGENFELAPDDDPEFGERIGKSNDSDEPTDPNKGDKPQS